MGEMKLVWDVANNPDRGTGPLTPHLRRAAGKHTLVLGAQPPRDMVVEFLAGAKLGPQIEPVAALQTIGVTLDLGHPVGPARRVTLDLGGWVKYPTAAAAEAARPQLGGVVRAFLERFVETPGAGPLLPPEVVAELLAPVKAAAWECDGDTLRATARTGADLAAIQVRLQERAVREGAAANMRAVARALRQYHDAHKRYPPAVVTDADGKPLYSWRVLLLPYLGGEAVYRRFHLNRAWSHPSNLPLLDQMPEVFAAPGGAGGHLTPYQVLTGPGGLFDTPDGRGQSDIADGPPGTILFVEAARPVPWTQPADVEFGPDVPAKLGGTVPAGFLAAMADGDVHFIPRPAAVPELLRGLFTRAGGEAVKLP